MVDEAILKTAWSGLVYDALLDVAGVDGAVDDAPVPLDPGMVCYGPAFTVFGADVEDATADETLLAWTDMLSRPPPGSVLLVTADTRRQRALMGELSSEALQRRGVRGAIVDGAVRDCAAIRQLGFPVYGKGRTPRDVVASWMPQALGEPVTLGGVRVAAGDMLFADDDGVVSVPGEHWSDVIGRVSEMMSAENLVREGIRAGMTPRDAYLAHRKF